MSASRYLHGTATVERLSVEHGQDSSTLNGTLPGHCVQNEIVHNKEVTFPFDVSCVHAALSLCSLLSCALLVYVFVHRHKVTTLCTPRFFIIYCHQ